MNARWLLPALALPILAGCTKSGAEKAKDGNAQATGSGPKRNTAESLGFASESSEGYFQQKPSSPAPAAPASATTHEGPGSGVRPIRRTLTAKDGRTVEADLLARTTDAVKIRRKADAAEFTVPLEKLSDADRAFIEKSALPPAEAR